VLLVLEFGIHTVEHGFDVESHQFVPSALWEVLVGSAPVSYQHCTAFYGVEFVQAAGNPLVDRNTAEKGVKVWLDWSSELLPSGSRVVQENSQSVRTALELVAKIVDPGLVFEIGDNVLAGPGSERVDTRRSLVQS
jgi:hypothetical protein